MLQVPVKHPDHHVRTVPPLLARAQRLLDLGPVLVGTKPDEERGPTVPGHDRRPVVRQPPHVPPAAEHGGRHQDWERTAHGTVLASRRLSHPPGHLEPDRGLSHGRLEVQRLPARKRVQRPLLRHLAQHLEHRPLVHHRLPVLGQGERLPGGGQGPLPAPRRDPRYSTVQVHLWGVEWVVIWNPVAVSVAVAVAVVVLYRVTVAVAVVVLDRGVVTVLDRGVVTVVDQRAVGGVVVTDNSAMFFSVSSTQHTAGTVVVLHAGCRTTDRVIHAGNNNRNHAIHTGNPSMQSSPRTAEPPTHPGREHERVLRCFIKPRPFVHESPPAGMLTPSCAGHRQGLPQQQR